MAKLRRYLGTGCQRRFVQFAGERLVLNVRSSFLIGRARTGVKHWESTIPQSGGIEHPLEAGQGMYWSEKPFCIGLAL